MVCHEDIPHTQHPHHHDLVLETDYPHEQTTCAAGEVSSYLNGVTIVLLAPYLLLFNNYLSALKFHLKHPKMSNACSEELKFYFYGE